MPLPICIRYENWAGNPVFGARCNLAKLLLYAINGGRDEITGEQVGMESSVYQDPVLDYDEVRHRLKIRWIGCANFMSIP